MALFGRRRPPSPRQVLADAAAERRQRHAELARAVEGIVQLREDIARKQAAKTRELAALQARLEGTHIDLALLRRRAAVVSELEVLTAELANVSRCCTEARAGLRDFEAEVEKLETEERQRPAPGRGAPRLELLEGGGE